MYRAVRRGSIHYRKFPRAADDTVQRVRIAGAVDELHSLALFLKMAAMRRSRVDLPQPGPAFKRAEVCVSASFTTCV